MSFESVGSHELAIRCDVKEQLASTLEEVEQGAEVQCDSTVNITYDSNLSGVQATQQVRDKLNAIGWDMILINNTWPGKVTCIDHCSVTFGIDSTCTVTQAVYDAASDQAIDLLTGAGLTPDDLDRFGVAIEGDTQSALTMALVRAPQLAGYLEKVTGLKPDDSFGAWLRGTTFADLTKYLKDSHTSAPMRAAIEAEFRRRGFEPPKIQARPRFGAPKARTEEHSVEEIMDHLDTKGTDQPSTPDTFRDWMRSATIRQLTDQLMIFVKEQTYPAERERIREELDAREVDNG